MNKKNLGRKMNSIIEYSREEGVCFSRELQNYNPNWDQVRETISRGEDKGKIVCIRRREPINLGLYVSSEYIVGRTLQ